MQNTHKINIKFETIESSEKTENISCYILYFPKLIICHGKQWKMFLFLFG